ncbi:hypothetical protein SESBI_26984 [Sesbania bispinosa]|nr:hypothetical protein SESBI_26984 [Sesbania bispinosa]
MQDTSSSPDSLTAMTIDCDAHSELLFQEPALTPAVATIQGDGNGDQEKAKSGEEAVPEKKPLEAGHKRKASTDIPSSVPSEIVSNPKSQRVSSSPPVSPTTGQQQLTDPVVPQGGEGVLEGGNKGLLIGGLLEGLDLNHPIEADGGEMEVAAPEIAVVAGTHNEVKAPSVVAAETKIETDGESDDSVVSPAVEINEVESSVGADQKEENKASDESVEPPTVEINNEVDQVEPADAMEKKKDKMEVEPNPTEEHEVMAVSKAEGDSSVTQNIDGGSGDGDGEKVVREFDLNELPPADDEE